MQIIKIYYNQSCSICNCEINYYKKKIKNPLFEWVNINDNIKAYIETKKTKDQLMRRMHASVHGHLVVGAKAFLIIWEEINYLRILAKILKNPIVYPIFFIAYEIVALPLYLKSKYLNR
jgi:predicted DCC family thiol-disulfide oxidoreductase YuxK